MATSLHVDGPNYFGGFTTFLVTRDELGEVSDLTVVAATDAGGDVADHENAYIVQPLAMTLDMKV